MVDLEEGKRLLSEATPGPPWSQDAYYIVGDVRGGRPNGEVIAGFRPSVAHLGMRPHPTKPGYFVEDRDVLNNRANTALAVWAVNNADSLIAAAEEAEKLRELLREARPVLEATLYAGSMDVAHLHALQDAARTLLDARIDAALTPPEPLSAQQATP